MARESKKEEARVHLGSSRVSGRFPKVNETYVCRSRAELEAVKLGVDELSGNVTGWGNQAGLMGGGGDLGSVWGQAIVCAQL